MAWTKAYLHTKWRIDASSRLATIEMGRKLGRGAGSPSNTVAWAESYLHAKYQLHPSSRLATINMGRKNFFFGGGSAPLSKRGSGSLSNTKSPGLRPTSIPSGILMHAAVWPLQIWAENWGLCHVGEGELGPHLAQCGLGRDLTPCQVAS